MTKLFGAVAIIGLMGCHPALAHDSQDHYKSVTKRIPTTYQSCEVVDVPIYGQAGGGASGADVLTGIIIGGLLGKGASGNDKGAAAGAVIGGMVAADKKQGNQQIIGKRGGEPEEQGQRDPQPSQGVERQARRFCLPTQWKHWLLACRRCR